MRPMIIINGGQLIKPCKSFNNSKPNEFSMGKVSLFFIVIGFVFLVPALVLTSIGLIFATFILNQPNWLGIVIAFVTGFLYIVAFAFIILGLIIAKRDKE
jgi:hypothetical protein